MLVAVGTFACAIRAEGGSCYFVDQSSFPPVAITSTRSTSAFAFNFPHLFWEGGQIKRKLFEETQVTTRMTSKSQTASRNLLFIDRQGEAAEENDSICFRNWQISPCRFIQSYTQQSFSFAAFSQLFVLCLVKADSRAMLLLGRNSIQTVQRVSLCFFDHWQQNTKS